MLVHNVELEPVHLSGLDVVVNGDRLVQKMGLCVRALRACFNSITYEDVEVIQFSSVLRSQRGDGELVPRTKGRCRSLRAYDEIPHGCRLRLISVVLIKLRPNTVYRDHLLLGRPLNRSV